MEDIVQTLRKRASIRRQIPTRRSVQEGKPDRLADLLDASADTIEELRTWKLFIDDERLPSESNFIIARNSFDAIWMIEHYGMPIHIAFDHDLGGLDTSMTLIHYISNKLMDGKMKLPKGFSYSVHSMNPIGKQNIIGLMNAIIFNFKEED